MKLINLLKEIVIDPDYEDVDRGFLRSLNTAIAQYIITNRLNSGPIDSIIINLDGSEYVYPRGEFPTPEEIATIVTTELGKRGIATKQSFLLHNGLIEPEDASDIPVLYPTALSIIPKLHFVETSAGSLRYEETGQVLVFVNAYHRGTNRDILSVSFNHE